MSNVLEVKGVCFGEGMPKVCVPLVATTLEECIEKVEQLQGENFDVLEVRMDYLPKECYHKEFLQQMFLEIRNRIIQPILATFRTKEEGGEQEIAKEEYKELYQVLITNQLVEMIDLELFLGQEILKELVELAKNRGIVLVLSNHDFHKTPSCEEIKERLCKMKEYGADLCKIAVMPESKEDVYRLINTTYELSTQHSDMLVITMSMGKLGAVSRVIGELTGSVMTFASFGKASAPGQISLGELSQVLHLLH